MTLEMGQHQQARDFQNFILRSWLKMVEVGLRIAPNLMIFMIHHNPAIAINLGRKIPQT